MSVRRFVVLLALWALVLLLSASPLGVIPGLFVGFSVAFFVGPLIMLSHIPEAALWPIAWTLVALYSGLVLFLAGRGVLLWLRNDRREARVVWFWTVSLIGFVLAIKFSNEALIAAWH